MDSFAAGFTLAWSIVSWCAGFATPFIGGAGVILLVVALMRIYDGDTRR